MCVINGASVAGAALLVRFYLPDLPVDRRLVGLKCRKLARLGSRDPGMRRGSSHHTLRLEDGCRCSLAHKDDLAVQHRDLLRHDKAAAAGGIL